MLGRYENFPKNIHGIARSTCEASPKKVQRAIVSAFFQLNQERFRLKEIAYSHLAGCEVDFEFGVGEDNAFTFLDNNELAILETEIAGKTLLFLDFLCVLQYHTVVETGKRAPLKFDYYLLRFVFGRNYMEFLVSHERGPQRVHTEDLIGFLAKRVKNEMANRFLVTLKLECT